MPAHRHESGSKIKTRSRSAVSAPTRSNRSAVAGSRISVEVSDPWRKGDGSGEWKGMKATSLRVTNRMSVIAAAIGVIAIAYSYRCSASLASHMPATPFDLPTSGRLSWKKSVIEWKIVTVSWVSYLNTLTHAPVGKGGGLHILPSPEFSR